jgi:predicted transposase/invertase (TIGR01784 family)
MSKRKNEVETGVARGISEGERLGIEKGERLGKLETAKNMLHFGLAKEEIVKMTGLSIEDLNFSIM